MEPQRYLRCLGPPALFTYTGEPIRFRTKKHLALLVFLAVEPRRSHRRDRLAELLWPNVTVAEARHSLATALSILRPRLGPDGLDTNRDQVQLTPGRVVLDLDRLAAGDVLGSDITGPLEVAAFLDGFEIPDTSEYMLWKDRQQARLLPIIKDALAVLIDRCRRTGDSRQIEQLADRMLALDELSEEAVRAKMEARAFAGDRLTALKIFEAWKGKLSQELNAAPSELVEGMAVRLRRRGWERTTLSNIPTVPTDQWRGRTFIGRAAEYRMVYEAWEGVRRGIPGHAIVLGDSGIGKTTLVERLTTAAGLEGAAISRVQCYDLEREIPYATLSSLIHGLLDRPGVSATPPEALAELARTVPEVRRRYPSIPPSGESQGETARIRLTESFHEMLQAIAEEHPVILVVDDLHLADDASLAVLHLVMRRARGQEIMVVLIARPGELPRAPKAAQLRENAAGLGIREVELAPLREEESGELLGALLSSDQLQLGALVRRTLLRAARGFPMVLELLVQDWRTNGDQSLALAVDAMTADLGSGSAPPAIYGQVLDRIIRTLDPTTHTVLNIAAILGYRLNDLGMYGIADLTTGQAMAGMTELVSMHVLRDGGQGLEFVNELVRTAAYLGVPSPLRRVLHGSIADKFIQEQERESSSLGLEIAWHCTRAGRSQQATPYLLQGARHAIEQGALDSAEHGLSTALPHLTGKDRREAMLLLVEVLQDQGRWAESAAVLLDCRFEQPSELATIFSILAEHRTGSSTAAHLARDVRTLIEIIDNGSDTFLRLKAASAAARLLPDLRDAQISSQLVRSVDRIPHEDLSEEDAIQLAARRAQILYHAHDHAGSLQTISDTLHQIQDRGTVNSTTATLYTGLGAIRCFQGKYEGARIEFGRAFEIALRIGNETLQGVLAAQISLCCGRLGSYLEQIEWARKATATFVGTFSGYNEVQATYYKAFGLSMRGYPREALAEIAALDMRIVTDNPPWLIQAWRLGKADVLFLCGQQSSAMAIARDGLELPDPTLHTPSFAGMFARWLALTSDTEQQRETAAPLLGCLLSRLDAFDALDQVEILCAKRMLSRDTVSDDITTSIEQRLQSLPPAIGDQLRRLGMLGERLSPTDLPKTDAGPADASRSGWTLIPTRGR